MCIRDSHWSAHDVAVAHTDIPDQLQKWKVMHHLPQEIWKSDHCTNQYTEPKIATLQEMAMRRENHAQQKSEQKECDGVLIFKTDAGQYAEPDPVAPIAGMDKPDDKPNATHPYQRFPGIIGQPVMEDQICWNHDNGDRRHSLGKSASSHLSREFPGQPNQCRSRQSRQQANAQRRIPENIPNNPCQPHGQRRMIHITPIHAQRARPVVHFVAKDAVATRGREMQYEFARREIPHQGRAGGESIQSSICMDESEFHIRSISLARSSGGKPRFSLRIAAMLVNGVSSNYWVLSRKEASVWEQSWEQIENKLRE